MKTLSLRAVQKKISICLDSISKADKFELVMWSPKEPKKHGILSSRHISILCVLCQEQVI